MVSSTNVLIFAFSKQLGMSYIKNRSGPRVEPCGTPHWIESGFDLAFSTSTYCVLLSKLKSETLSSNSVGSSLLRLLREGPLD